MSPSDAPSHSEHMRTMFELFLKTERGQRLVGRLGVDDLYAVYVAGFLEGMWTERVQPGSGRRMSRREPWQRAGD